MADKLFSLEGKRIWVSGHRGMVGSALIRALEGRGVKILTVGRKDVDLRRQAEVECWMKSEKPDAVIVASARVGGIHANSTYPAEFIYDNLMIASNVIHAAHETDVEKLLYLGSSCIYPRDAEQPMREEALLTGPLEETNQWYAVAKIAGIKLCQAYRKEYGRDFISAMPTNLYGPGDNFHPENSHVLPALMRRFHEAKEEAADKVTIWGSGKPKREFMHVDDCARALIHLLEAYSGETHVNVGTGEEISIANLATLVAAIVGFKGTIELDSSKPDGTPRKLMNVSRLEKMGFRPMVPLKEGIAQTYEWYQKALADRPDELREISHS